MTVFAILVGVSATRDAGAGLPLEIEWDVPNECPKSAYVVHRVEQILHGPPRERVGVTAAGKIVRAKDAPRFELVLTVRSGGFEETKSVTASSCAGLAEAAAVVIALAIRSSDAPPPATPPESVVSAEPTAAPTVPEDPPPAMSAPAPSPATSERERSPAARAARVESRAFGFAFDLGGSVVSGPLPHAAPGIDAAAALKIGRFRAGALGTFSFRQSPSYADSARASFDMMSLGAFGAYILPVGTLFGIGPHVDAEATFVRVQGYGIRTPRGSTSVWPTVAFGARAEARVARWMSVFARGDLLFALGAPRFTLVTAGDALVLHEPAPLAPRLSLGVEIVVP